VEFFISKTFSPKILYFKNNHLSSQPMFLTYKHTQRYYFLFQLFFKKSCATHFTKTTTRIYLIFLYIILFNIFYGEVRIGCEQSKVFWKYLSNGSRRRIAETVAFFVVCFIAVCFVYFSYPLSKKHKNKPQNSKSNFHPYFPSIFSIFNPIFNPPNKKSS